MFCQNCKNRIPDDAVFCEHCGAPVKQEQKTGSPSVSNTPFLQSNPEKQGETVKKITQFIKENPKNTAIAVGAVVVVASIAVFVATRPVTVHLEDYVTVEYSGYDTIGNASYSFDNEAFLEDYGEKIEYLGNSTEPLSLLDDERACQMLIQECVDADLSKNTGLSNGEEISLHWTCDNDTAMEDFGVRLSYEDMTFTVEGLNEAEEVDPFANIEINYTGTAPNGEASIINNSDEDYAYDLNYTVEPSEGLNNGDTITVSLSQAGTEENREYYLNNYGIIFTQTEKSYTVEGLGTYITSLSQIDENTLNEMISTGEDALRAEAAQDWDEPISLDSMTYLGSYLLSAKDEDTDRNNMLYLVYQVQSSGSFPDEGIQESFIYYYTIRFDNLIVTPDGTVEINLTDYATTNNSFVRELGNNRYRYHGYEDLDTTFRQCVTVNVDRYTYETSVNTGQTTTQGSEG